ncbi:Amino Acid/Auxin Permease (AAAP) Family [Achlya hypogyna]|uniref:Amino Acid/Auxin Permease (AAAP) Family n=1 Tax=Achlya hypogyna TaxID=1202772 RepID=A0A1V9YM74_ACHHY|nr:Amino Acid/Auxin Permease (AAAP) Family [Achlya hypogyna]
MAPGLPHVHAAAAGSFDQRSASAEHDPVSMGEYVMSPTHQISPESLPLFATTPPSPVAIKDYKGTGTVLGSVFTLTNTILGSGTLAVPFAIASSGWFAGLVVMVTIALITRYSVSLLMRASDAAGDSAAKTYESLGHHTMGKYGTYLAEFTFIFGGFGTLTSYFIFITDLLVAIFEITPVYRGYVTVAFTFGIILPLSLSRRLGKLRVSSVLATCAVTYVVCLFLVVYIVVSSSATFVPVAVPAVNLSSGSVYTVTLLIQAFACHNTALPVYEEMQNRSVRRMNYAVVGAISLSFLLYTIIGFCGVFTFGGATMDNVLLNFTPAFLATYPAIRTPLWIGRLCMGIALLFCAPIAMWPFRSCVLSVLLRVQHGKQLPSSVASKVVYRSTTLVLVVLILGAALFVPSVKIPLSIVGSVAGSLIIFIMPSLFYMLQQTDRPLLSVANTGPLLMLTTGVCVGVLCFSMTMYKLRREFFP